MGYLDELEELSSIMKTTEDLNYAQRIIMIEMIEDKVEQEQLSDDYFIRFYEVVTEKQLGFDYAGILDSSIYSSASDEAKACLTVFPKFKTIQANSSLLSWIVNALKFTDHLALHYIQNILKEPPYSDPNNGIERSRYIQINHAKNRAHVAGRILNNLYDQRNKLEHRTIKDPNNPEKQKIIAPNFNKARKKIISDYPKALLSFEVAFNEFYQKI